VNVSFPTGVPDDDVYWRRPAPGAAGPGPDPTPPSGPRPAEPPRYAGPPRTAQPSPHWRPPTIAQPPPPRQLPPQNLDALEEAEGSARTITYGVGLVAGAIALILLCLVCGRVIF
jgi:hypothetical protein